MIASELAGANDKEATPLHKDCDTVPSPMISESCPYPMKVSPPLAPITTKHLHSQRRHRSNIPLCHLCFGSGMTQLPGKSLSDKRAVLSARRRQKQLEDGANNEKASPTKRRLPVNTARLLQSTRASTNFRGGRRQGESFIGSGNGSSR